MALRQKALKAWLSAYTVHVFRSHTRPRTPYSKALEKAGNAAYDQASPTLFQHIEPASLIMSRPISLRHRMPRGQPTASSLPPISDIAS